MKRIIALILALIAICVIFCSCGNRAIGYGNFTFKHIHFSDAVEGHCATIEKWYDNEQGIEVKTKEFGSMYLSEGSYILIEDGTHCPYCSK